MLSDVTLCEEVDFAGFTGARDIPRRLRDGCATVMRGTRRWTDFRSFLRTRLSATDPRRLRDGETHQFQVL